MTETATTLVRVVGGTIATRVTGEGPPVVLVHGAGGDGHNWDKLVARLEDHRRCIVVDRAGYGESRWTAPEPPARADHGRHLVEVVEALGATGCDAIGTSSGALATVEALRNAPGLFRRAVLIEPPLHVVPDDGPSDGGDIPARPAPPPDETPDELRARGEASVRRTDHAAWEALSERERERYVASFPAMFRETGQPPYRVSRTELAALGVPALVLYGTASTERLVALSAALSDALSDATLVALEGAAHLMYITHTDEVAALVDGFLGA